MSKKKRAKPYRVEVTEADIRGGVSGDCFRCAVALGLQRATDDDEASVYDGEWGIMYLVVHSREILCPHEARGFIWEYDRLPRDPATQKPILPDVLPEKLRPFKFVLPSFSNRAWQERCSGCEEHYAPKKLNDEGYCPECAKEESAS